MKDINCILLDIDNTLTNSNEEISNEISEYFAKINKTYHIILVTGRTNTYAIEKSKICNASPIVISDNGAVVYNYLDDEILFSNFFDKDVIKNVWDISQKYNIDCVFNTLYKRYRNNIFMNEKYIKNNNIGIDSIDEVNNDVTQIVLLSNNEKEHDICLNEIKKLNNIEICNEGKEKDGRYFADLNVKGTSKGNAITELYNILKIKKDNSICFGDSMNDVSMFEACGYRVAMKNSTDTLKAMADYITEYSNNENGVIRFLKKHL